MTGLPAPDRELLDDPRTRTIRIDGVEWPVPKLTPSQNEVVVPILIRMMPKLLKFREARAAQQKDAPAQSLAEMLGELGEILTEQGLRDMNTCVYQALKRGHKGLDRKVFDDEMVVGALDGIEALMVIAGQTGVFRQARPGERAPLAVAPADTPA